MHYFYLSPIRYRNIFPATFLSGFVRSHTRLWGLPVYVQHLIRVYPRVYLAITGAFRETEKRRTVRSLCINNGASTGCGSYIIVQPAHHRPCAYHSSNTYRIDFTIFVTVVHVVNFFSMFHYLYVSGL